MTRPGFDQNSNNNNTKVERPTSFVDLPNSTSSCSELASKKKITGEGGVTAPPPSGGRKLGSGGGGGGGGWARLKGGPSSSAAPPASEHPPSKEQTTSSGLVTNYQIFPKSIFYNQPGMSVFFSVLTHVFLRLQTVLSLPALWPPSEWIPSSKKTRRIN